LTVFYGKRRAVEGVSLAVGPGEVVTLLGANGSGKSTTLRAISGLVRPARGRILLDGRDVTREPADALVAAGVSHVPEGREVFRTLAQINATGVAVLLVEQNARRALRLAARGYVLETGRVATAGTSRELAADARVRSAYLGLGQTAAPPCAGPAGSLG